MIKTTKWMLTALLMMGLSMGFVACSDDDDYDGGVPTNETEYKKSQLGWDIITQLTSERTAPDGWEDMTFEPTIGKASDTDPYTRIVATNDLAAAAERFGGLIGFPTTISETTNSFTYNQQGMGKLIYQKGSEDGEYLAQVEVDLKQVPHLKKILYQTPEQMGNNSYFDGTAYYRFGDVVMDKDGYYWICVRPAFGPEGKEDSHWLCFSHNLPEENIKEYKTSTGVQNYLPTGLGKSTEHMQNAAEMFYAMLFPTSWVNSLAGGNPPKMFNDFSFKDNYDYHNVYFWQNVCNAWETFNLFNLVLGVDKETLANDRQWHMLYSGYSWWFTTSWNCSLYEATFSQFTGKKANMHDVTYTSPTQDMHSMTLDAKSGSKVGPVNGPFFGNDDKLRWYVRYKKGSELGGGAYHVKLQMSGCSDVYVYNKYYGFYDLNADPEVTKAPNTGYENRGFYAMGDVVKDLDGNRWVCVQESPNDKKNNPNSNYAYFVSFDQNALGSNFSSLPSKNLAMQILFDMTYIIHHYYDRNPTSPSTYAAKSIKDYAGVDIDELGAIRDTLHTYNDGTKKNVSVEFASALYKDSDGELCVLRMISDNTASQPGNGGRDWSWRAYDSYTQDLTTSYSRRMLLNHLKDQDFIKNYNKDRWVTCPWINPVTKERTPSPGYLTTAQNVTLSNLVYKAGRSWLKGTAPTNIYREPLLAFAVKRINDTGKEVNRFDDNTFFQKVHYVSADDDVIFDKTYQTNQFIMVYDNYQHQMFLNDKSYSWGLNNAK